MSSPVVSRHHHLSIDATTSHASSLERLQLQVEKLGEFFDFHNLKKPSNAADRAAWQAAINEAYQNISAELTPSTRAALLPLMTQVLTYNAHRLYGGDMNLTRLFFLMALSLQLRAVDDDSNAALDFISEEKTLEGLTARISNQPQILNDLQTGLVSSFEISQVLPKCSSEQCIFDLAANLDWLGRCCQNLNEYKQNPALFNKLYGAARSAYTHLIETTADTTLKTNSNWQMADNHYNTGRFLYSLEKPDDIAGKLRTLDALRPYLEAENGSLRAVTKAAQIENISAMELLNLRKQLLPMQQFLETMQHPLLATFRDSAQQAFAHAKKALEIAQEYQSKGFDPFLLSMFYNNVASIGMECEKLTASEAAVYSEEAIKMAKEQDLNHFYFAGYFRFGAKIAIALGDAEKAKKYEADAADLDAKFGR